MAPKIKLIYFDARGRAEMNRIMLNYGGVEFEDYIIKYEEWEQIKPSMSMKLIVSNGLIKITLFQHLNLDSCQR